MATPVCYSCRHEPAAHPSGLCGQCLGAMETRYGEFTCRACKSVATCEYAWDIYSTDGDCLREK
nr:hypothetical protein [Candidatus Sigynarchaeum springense]